MQRTDDPATVFVPAASTEKDCSITVSMFDYPQVSRAFPFYCSMREQCVLTDVHDTTVLSDPFDNRAPNFLYILGTLHFV